MEEIKLHKNDNGKGAFVVTEEEDPLGEMEVSITADTLTVYHTEVQPKAEGKGLAKQLLTAMVAYARENELKVVPLCPYVQAQFKRHPEEYADIWKQNKKETS
ncbi:MAG TPA: GNAT family N-acetyltransferase [Flavisolibacter sp.]|jgi:hypothetical protein|nr:GNAT family N-acetyltransferase [Flavisolibacter sp.]